MLGSAIPSHPEIARLGKAGAKHLNIHSPMEQLHLNAHIVLWLTAMYPAAIHQTKMKHVRQSILWLNCYEWKNFTPFETLLSDSCNSLCCSNCSIFQDSSLINNYIFREFKKHSLLNADIKTAVGFLLTATHMHADTIFVCIFSAKYLIMTKP